MLFFLGGLVRVSGSGMGCPDWPKCFGSWVPPTNADQLPDDYKELYLEKRQKKLNRLVGFLQNIGMNERADAILKTKGIMEAHPFNVRTAYVEYVNRLWGALTGIFALLAVFFSLKTFKTDRKSTLFAVLGLFFIIYNGWLGSMVVDTNLFGGLVTVHFVLAFLSIFFFMLSYYRHASFGQKSTSTLKIKSLLITTLAVSTFQLISGTQVREFADAALANGEVISGNSIELLGNLFIPHRLLVFVLILLVGSLLFLYRKDASRAMYTKYTMVLMALIIAQIITGSLNVFFNLPAVSQLLHVLLGSLLIVGVMTLIINEFKLTLESKS